MLLHYGPPTPIVLFFEVPVTSFQAVDSLSALSPQVSSIPATEAHEEGLAGPTQAPALVLTTREPRLHHSDPQLPSDTIPSVCLTSSVQPITSFLGLGFAKFLTF